MGSRGHAAARDKNPIPLGWRLASILLIFCPPLLVAACIISFVGTRRCELRIRHAQARHWCFLLLACVVVLMLAMATLAWWAFEDPALSAPQGSAIDISAFPPAPSEGTLTARDIARAYSPLVVGIVYPDNRFGYRGAAAEPLTLGAGAVAFADENGYLVLTSRHVVEAVSPGTEPGQKVGVSLQDNQAAVATVVGIHKRLDLALLWVQRSQGNEQFVQAVRPFGTVEIGEQVFVIGHPEGLAFSISGGLVAQKRGDDVVQLSAPVSPGNSGGPVYDSNGRLVGIVQSVIDKAISPNAENLNFAVRADDLHSPDAWELSEPGRSALRSISDSLPGRSVEADTSGIPN